MDPAREIYWNIVAGKLIYLLFAISLLTIAAAFFRRVRLWRLGGPGRFFLPLWPRLKSVFLDGFFQRRMFRGPYVSAMHIFIYTGFLILFVGTLLIAVQLYFLPGLLRGNFYLSYSLALDVFGLLAMVGVLMAAFRRYLWRPEHLANSREDGLALALFFLVLLTGFMVEGARIATTELEQHPRWAYFSPAGFLFAKAFVRLGWEDLTATHRVLWWSHAGLSFLFIAFVGVTKLSHLVLAPLNIFLRNLAPKGAMQLIDFQDESQESFGAQAITDFSWKQLMDLDVCTSCGRCQAACPTYLSQKPLSPSSVIQAMKAHFDLYSRGYGEERPTLIRGAVKEEAVWACRLCGACQEVCPLFIEPMNKLIEMRRYLVLMETSMPDGGKQLIKSLEDNHHPWRGTRLSRTQWQDGIRLESLADKPGRDYLFWVGCTGALMERNVKVTRAVARLLQAGGIDFGVLGADEVCCGDPARRAGHEYLFQVFARLNIETMRSYGVKKVLVHCPHCYNTLKNEYPQLGGQFEVIHTTELFAQLVQEGRLRPEASMAQKISFHDPCYLGRINGVFKAPRAILKALPDTELVEMELNRKYSFCCGGGGGHIWMEEATGTRVSRLRLDQADKTGAQAIAVSCPFCLQLFEEGLEARSGPGLVAVMDVAELLDAALGKLEAKPSHLLASS